MWLGKQPWRSWLEVPFILINFAIILNTYSWTARGMEDMLTISCEIWCLDRKCYWTPRRTWQYTCNPSAKELSLMLYRNSVAGSMLWYFWKVESLTIRRASSMTPGWSPYGAQMDSVYTTPWPTRRQNCEHCCTHTASRGDLAVVFTDCSVWEAHVMVMFFCLANSDTKASCLLPLEARVRVCSLKDLRSWGSCC